MNYVNLTPHEINVYKPVVTADGSTTEERELAITFPPSGNVARVDVKPVYRITDTATGIEFYSQQVGDVVGLPEKKTSTWLIVSAQVRLALPHRSDLVSPGELMRNATGQPIGCVGFYFNVQYR